MTQHIGQVWLDYRHGRSSLDRFSTQHSDEGLGTRLLSVTGKEIRLPDHDGPEAQQSVLAAIDHVLGLCFSDLRPDDTICFRRKGVEVTIVVRDAEPSPVAAPLRFETDHSEEQVQHRGVPDMERSPSEEILVESSNVEHRSEPRKLLDPDFGTVDAQIEDDLDGSRGGVPVKTAFQTPVRQVTTWIEVPAVKETPDHRSAQGNGAVYSTAREVMSRRLSEEPSQTTSAEERQSPLPQARPDSKAVHDATSASKQQLCISDSFMTAADDKQASEQKDAADEGVGVQSMPVQKTYSKKKKRDRQNALAMDTKERTNHGDGGVDVDKSLVEVCQPISLRDEFASKLSRKRTTPDIPVDTDLHEEQQRVKRQKSSPLSSAKATRKDREPERDSPERPNASNVEEERMDVSTVAISEAKSSTDAIVIAEKSPKRKRKPRSSDSIMAEQQHDQGTTPSSRKAFSRKVTKVLFTYTKPDSATEKWLDSKGIKIVEDLPTSKTAFVCVVPRGQLRTTVKVLKTLIMAKPVVTEDWLEESKAADELLDYEPFIHKDLSYTRDRHQTFSKKQLVFTRAVTKAYGKSRWVDIQVIAKDAGAKNVKTCNVGRDGPLNHDDNPEDVIFVGDDEQDDDAMSLALDHGRLVFNRDFFAHSIVVGQTDLNDEKFLLNHNDPTGKKRGYG